MYIVLCLVSALLLYLTLLEEKETHETSYNNILYDKVGGIYDWKAIVV